MPSGDEARSEIVLEMQGICKDFPGVKALQNASLRLRVGEVHALIGENGAGKSTLIKILAGALPATSGEIVMNGKPVHIASPIDAMHMGISVIYQELMLIPHMSVAENIYLGREPKTRIGTVDFSAMQKQAQIHLDRLSAGFASSCLVSDLNIAQRQIVEIAKAVSHEVSVLVMDEPTASLTDREIEKLFELIVDLKSQGVSIVYISHRMEEIFQIASVVTVMRDGEYIGTENITDISMDQLVNMMVGRKLIAGENTRSIENRPISLELKSVCSNKISDISLKLGKGEILGLAGLVGAGRSEVARAVFGADAMTSGEIWIDGKLVQIRCPSDAIEHGIGFVTEDRKSLGLVLPMSVRENTTLANLGKYTQGLFVNRIQETKDSQTLAESLRTKITGVEMQTGHLSGGNQQKVVLAKWLCRQCQILIFDEPTRGIDVAAKAEIYELIRQLADTGVSVLVISSELPEVLLLCERIIVMHEGRITGELSRKEATQEKILSLAMNLRD